MVYIHDDWCYDDMAQYLSECDGCDGYWETCDDPWGHADLCTHCDGMGNVWVYDGPGDCSYCEGGWVYDGKEYGPWWKKKLWK